MSFVCLVDYYLPLDIMIPSFVWFSRLILLGWWFHTCATLCNHIWNGDPQLPISFFRWTWHHPFCMFVSICLLNTLDSHNCWFCEQFLLFFQLIVIPGVVGPLKLFRCAILIRSKLYYAIQSGFCSIWLLSYSCDTDIHIPYIATVVQYGCIVIECYWYPIYYDLSISITLLSNDICYSYLLLLLLFIYPLWQ